MAIAQPENPVELSALHSFNDSSVKHMGERVTPAVRIFSSKRKLSLVL